MPDQKDQWYPGCGGPLGEKTYRDREIPEIEYCSRQCQEGE